ncbi:MAG: thiamine ABC transporter substrate-binding protein [Candidatus Heimdallarchaeaceae archaeon]
MKLNSKIVISFLFILLVLEIFNANPVAVAADDSVLTIYTYESLLADPGYDFIEGFANYSGIPKEDIKLVLMDDANTIVTQAALEKDNPVADVLIGIDNVLIHTAKEEGILEVYDSPALVNISTDLISNLDPEKYVLPYDYGIIALWYDCSRINSSTTPELDTLTLDDILELNLDKMLVVEDPTLSSPGLGFLLWTIAVYGDPELDFTGLLGKDWREWWREAAADLRITPSWGAAFDIYYTEEENRPIMISYGTSPAYDVCHPIWGVGTDAEQPSKAIVSHENGKENAWLQIEGIGLVKNAPHKDAAKQFIDWFLSSELQENIPLNQWMYPANKNVNVSSCFLNTAINPDDVDILNDLISPTMLRQNLDKWKSDWETVIVEGTERTSATNLYIVMLTIVVSSLSYTVIRRKKK